MQPVVAPVHDRVDLEIAMRSHPGAWLQVLLAVREVLPKVMGPWEDDPEASPSAAWRPHRRRVSLDFTHVAYLGWLGNEPCYCMVGDGETVIEDTIGDAAACEAKLKELGWLLA